MTQLSLHGVTHAYDAAGTVLTEVDFRADTGRLLTLVGPNGAGKSTLLMILSGLLLPDRGEARLDGRPLARMGARERARRIARVPQGLEALPETDVLGFVHGGRYPHLGPWGRTRGGDLEAVRRALEAADASHLADRALAELSGGQRQRVLVARALAQESDWLVVDEPTTALDPEHAVTLFGLLARLAHAGRGVLVATHDLALAGAFAERVVVLHGGRIVADGSAEEVLIPRVLSPVYGPFLHYGHASRGPSGGIERPLVTPWLPPDSPGSAGVP